MSQFPYRGLTDAEVRQSRARHGANVFTPRKRESAWKRFFEKLTGPLGHHIKGWHDGDHLIFILEIAAILSILISLAQYYGWMGLTRRGLDVFFEPTGILLAILLATGIAFIFELKADKEFVLLNKVNDEEKVHALRNGNVVVIERRDVVVGDIIILETGQEIPADGTLLKAVSLTVDESSLTGELSCSKTVKEELFDAEATYPSNQVLRGTKVMEGHGVFRVTAVGDATENGKVYEETQIDDSVKTPLDEQLDGLGRLISVCSYVIAALVVVGRILSYLISGDFVWADFVTYILETIMIAVTLIVVAVPEGLPMAVTMSLAYSMRRMLKTNNLVRKIHACETMGATTVICTDKTGTLTQNEMRVAQCGFYSLPAGAASLPDTAEGRLVAQGIAVNSTAHLHFEEGKPPTVIGNPTEGALLLWLDGQGVDYRQVKAGCEVVAEIPFSTERKYMAVVAVCPDGVKRLFVKGAPELLLERCATVAGGVSRDEVLDQLKQYQHQAMRTLAFACQEVEEGEQVVVDGGLQAARLRFMGLVAIADPVRAEVPDAVRQCRLAGIRVIVITGDNQGTAMEVGRQVGIWRDNDGEENHLTGQQVAAMSDEELRERVKNLKIVSRARPGDKRRIVRALIANGEVVAVTGDGTNDAPALNAAHVGLSMGDGTAVAKEASDITIVDNSFASIGRAVMWGRSLYKNIQRFILFQLTVNVAACLVVLVGSFLGKDSPLTVTQMLWVNLIMDTFAAMAFATLPPSREVMDDKPRDRAAFIITRAMWWQILGVGLLFSFILIAFFFLLDHSDLHNLTDINLANITHSYQGINSHELSLFFTTFVMLQFWNMFNAKAFGGQRLPLIECRGFLFITAIILVGQIAIVTLGGAFFNVEPLAWNEWLSIIVATMLVWLVPFLIRIKR